MTRAIIAKSWTFAAAHHLPALPSDHKCHRPHGHNYRVTLEVQGPIGPLGMVIDYGELDDTFGEYIRTTLDHRDLNVVLPIATTAELLADWLRTVAVRMFPGATSVRVTVAEGSDTWAMVG